MGKWEPVNPADLKPGDEFKAKRTYGETARVVMTGFVRDVVDHWVYDAEGCNYSIDSYEWFRRKPKKLKRPAEPPAGTMVRNLRTGHIGIRDNETRQPWLICTTPWHQDGWRNWDDWIDPGDEIEIAEWVKP